MTKQDGEEASSHIHFKILLYPPLDVLSNLMQGNFDQERKGEIKLYVKKVLISEKFKMMPKYPSFVKGVIPLDYVNQTFST